MGVNHRIDVIDPLAQALRAEIGAGVDDESALRRNGVDGGAAAAVARIGRRADGAMAADHRDAERGARAEEREIEAGH